MEAVQSERSSEPPKARELDAKTSKPDYSRQKRYRDSHTESERARVKAWREVNRERYNELQRKANKISRERKKAAAASKLT